MERKCLKCDQVMEELGDLIQNSEEAEIISETVLVGCDLEAVYFCKNKECDRFSLLQVNYGNRFK